MRLMQGTRLGAYEILSPVGAGGMGEVYGAIDSKLGREVAVKILPAEMAQDPDRVAAESQLPGMVLTSKALLRKKLQIGIPFDKIRADRCVEDSIL